MLNEVKHPQVEMETLRRCTAQGDNLCTLKMKRTPWPRARLSCKGRRFDS